ncbi:hypothetical protein [Staphylococcus warneri]|uniref:hypothetical protein n=1 Tax=Staphylococcus warneri TaxID=1292 RepID=UPI0025437A21|nr:hypothetical protein [Staphylococcus warneri]MDK4265702.1 hypothetical protein [Staphylococcus warneri]
MKKFIILLPLLILMLSACSGGTLKQAQGQWKNENDDTVQIKDDHIKFITDDATVEGTVKEDQQHDHLLKTHISGVNGYVKIDDDQLSLLEKPDSNPDDYTTFNKVK